MRAEPATTEAGATSTLPRPTTPPPTAPSATGSLSRTRACGCTGCGAMVMRLRPPAGSGSPAAPRAS
eukprot:4215235-Alexandrium_andersonii.AAC.1